VRRGLALQITLLRRSPVIAFSPETHPCGLCHRARRGAYVLRTDFTVRVRLDPDDDRIYVEPAAIPATHTVLCGPCYRDLRDPDRLHADLTRLFGCYQN
jgi:hypothetical protein